MKKPVKAKAMSIHLPFLYIIIRLVMYITDNSFTQWKRANLSAGNNITFNM